jgi:ribosomal protein L32E
VNEHGLAGIESAKKKSTAELRLRFWAIHALVQKGYTHKQICDQLNSAGITISYAYYRVVMTRLRGELNASSIAQTVGENKTAEKINRAAAPTLVVGHSDGDKSEVKLFWDPDSPIKW